MIPSFRTEETAVSLLGSAASSTLQEAHSGRLAAVFSRSFYAEFPGGYVCFGSEEIGSGPLNALMPGARASTWRGDRPRVGESLEVQGSRVRLENGSTIDLSKAEIWEPGVSDRMADPDMLAVNLRALEAATRVTPCDHGLLRLAYGAGEAVDDDPCLSYASRPFDELRQWLDASLSAGSDEVPDCPHDVIRLIGAGPGLTPSGDDVLAGAMVTLHRLHEEGTLQCLADRIAARLADRTNAISAAHLKQAMMGGAGERVLGVVDDLMFGRAIDPESVLRTLSTVGATSGLDALAGIVLVLDGWTGANQRPSTSH